MLLNEMYLESVREHREREQARAAREGRHEALSPSLRRQVGLSIMRIGARMAMEPQVQHRLARSR